MKVGIPIAAYEEGTTGEYVLRAFQDLGIEAAILSQYDFYSAIDRDEYDLYFCVDSGGPLNISGIGLHNLKKLNKVCFWMIDYRRGKTIKNPNDYDTCKLISDGGGWIFQSQFEDFNHCLSNKIGRVSWLPLGADIKVWDDRERLYADEKIYDVGFVGNVWDGVRQQVLEMIREAGLSLSFKGHGASRMSAGAYLLRHSRVGFNISSFFGEPEAYDANMRVFETLSCGIPLLTNYVPSLEMLGLATEDFVFTYKTVGEIVPKLREMLSRSDLETLGHQARNWAEQYATYTLRIQSVLHSLHSNGMISEVGYKL